MAIPSGAPRFAWDLTNAEAFLFNGDNTVRRALTAGEKELLAGEDLTTFIEEDDGTLRGGWVALVFPPLELHGYLMSLASVSSARNSEYSTDTTDGYDGTWTVLPDPTQIASPNHIDDTYGFVTPLAGVRGVRYGYTSNLTSIDRNQYRFLHLYGIPEGSVDRLALWHPTLDEPLAGDAFDAGTTEQGTLLTDTFRVKNLAASATANTVGVAIHVYDNSDSTPAQSTWVELSDDGSTFGATVALGNLAAGAISDVLTLRRDVPAAASVGALACHVRATPASWS